MLAAGQVLDLLMRLRVERGHNAVGAPLAPEQRVVPDDSILERVSWAVLVSQPKGASGRGGRCRAWRTPARAGSRLVADHLCAPVEVDRAARDQQVLELRASALDS